MPSPGMQGQPVYMAPQPFPPTPRQPVVRGSMPEEKPSVRPTPIMLPAPEKLGILPSPDQLGIKPQAAPTNLGVDWNATHARMKTLGVLSYSMERTPEGGWRFDVMMATAEAGRTYRIDGFATTEADAMRVCLDKTERWLKQTP